MNLSLGRFVQGVLGAFLGACVYLGCHMNFAPDDIFFRHINIMKIIIISAIFFSAFFFMGGLHLKLDVAIL